MSRKTTNIMKNKDHKNSKNATLPNEQVTNSKQQSF